jgi:hypothetical protein
VWLAVRRQLGDGRTDGRTDGWTSCHSQQKDMAGTMGPEMAGSILTDSDVLHRALILNLNFKYDVITVSLSRQYLANLMIHQDFIFT